MQGRDPRNVCPAVTTAGARLDLRRPRRGNAASRRQGNDHAQFGRIVTKWISQFGIVDAAVGTIGDQKFAIRHLICDADFGHAADHRACAFAAMEDGKIRSRTHQAGFAHDLVHRNHDVAALAQVAQLGLEFIVDMPDTLAGLLRQTHALELTQPPDAQDLALRVGIRFGPHDQDIVPGVLHDAEIDGCKALRPHLIGQLDRALEGRLRSEFARDQIAGSAADAMADIVARHDRR